MKDVIGISLMIILCIGLAYSMCWAAKPDRNYPTEDRRLFLRYIDGHVDTVVFRVSKEGDFRLYSSRGTYHLMAERKANIGWSETVVQHGVITFKEIK